MMSSRLALLMMICCNCSSTVLIGDNHFIAAGGFHHQFQDLEQFAVTTTEADVAAVSFNSISLLLEFHIPGDGSLQSPGLPSPTV